MFLKYQLLGLVKIKKILYNFFTNQGRLDQLARASRLHREGRGFEPLSAYQKNSNNAVFLRLGYILMLKKLPSL